MPFPWLSVEDGRGPKSEHEIIQSSAIAILGNYRRNSVHAPSPAWFGKHCRREKVRRSRLWNSSHVGEEYDPAFLDTLEGLGCRMQEPARQDHAVRCKDAARRRPREHARLPPGHACRHSGYRSRRRWRRLVPARRSDRTRDQGKGGTTKPRCPIEVTAALWATPRPSGRPRRQERGDSLSTLGGLQTPGIVVAHAIHGAADLPALERPAMGRAR